jgi:hypothetical protein
MAEEDASIVPRTRLIGSPCEPEPDLQSNASSMHTTCHNYVSVLLVTFILPPLA